MDENEQRAEELIKKYGFDIDSLPRDEIKSLLNKEIENYNSGSSEYLRVLCGYLFCIGDPEDIELIAKAKYNINFDVGCMIDSEWLDSLKGIQNDSIRSRTELIDDFEKYYTSYFSL